MARAGLLGAFASWLCALLLCAAGLALAAPVSLAARGPRRRDARAPDIHVVALRRCRLLPTQHVVRSRDSGRCGRPGGDGRISRAASTTTQSEPLRQSQRVSAFRIGSRNLLRKLALSEMEDHHAR